MRMNRWKLLLSLLAVFSLTAAACGDSGDDAGGDDSSTEDGAAAGGDAIKVAVVAPSASDDLAFTQSMIDSLDVINETTPLDISVTDGTFNVDDAAAAIRQYAEEGNTLVVVHGTQFGGSLEEIAPDFPEVSFAWGTAEDTLGQPNVFAYAPEAGEGGYVLGTIGAILSETGTIGIVGPVEAGDAVAYINGFAQGAEATGDVTVNISYTGSFSDVALMTEAANSQVAAGADVLTGSSQAVVGAVGVADSEGIPWFGTQSDQSSLSDTSVVASQVYRWDVILDDILDNIAAGTLGGETYLVNLENGGLEIAYNPAYELSDEARAAADAAIAGIIDGSITVNG